MTITAPELVPQALQRPDTTELSYEPEHDLATVRRHVTVALTELARRKDVIDKRWAYYNGDQDQLWLTTKLREVFGHTFDTKLHDNYCELAVEAVVLRLEVDGWQLVRPPAEDASEEEQAQADAAVAFVTTQWDANRLDLEQEELYRSAGVAGEHYVLAWPRYSDALTLDGEPSPDQAETEDGVLLWDITMQDARNVYLHVGTSPRDRQYAVKVWRDAEAKRWRATVYYAEEVVRLQTLAGSNGDSPPKADRFQLDPDDTGGENPLGVVPVFRFARNKAGKSRLDSLRPIQDKINKLSVGKIVAAEFAALKQRYALLGEDVPDHVLKAVPGSVWKLPAGGVTEDDPNGVRTQVGEFSAADLSTFDSAKREEVDAFLTIGMLPRNLRASAGGSASSGEQITKDNGPFVGMVEDHQQMYGGTWRDLWEALGVKVKPAWSPAAFANSKDVAEEVKLYTDAGVPVEAALTWAGRSEDELEQVRTLLDEGANRSATAAANALTALDTGGTALELLRGGLSGTGAGAPAVPPVDDAGAAGA